MRLEPRMDVEAQMPVLTDGASGVPQAVSLEQEELFPIREVSRLTGVNPVTLRAWERRYGLIVPTRTESGHRLYSMADIERVRSILGWIERGVAVSKIGKILAKAAPLQALSHLIPNDLVQADYAQWHQQLQAAVSAFDDVLLEQIYGQIFSSYSQPVVFQDILLPLWKQLLQRQDSFGRVSEWLFLDSFLRSRVTQRLLLIRDKHQGESSSAPCRANAGNLNY
jgi:DNA-binding transcriptional MerR regulator